MFSGREFICRWDLRDQLEKIDQVILVLAKTSGRTGAGDESFHYVKGYLLNGLKDLADLIDNELIMVDFCIDQVIGVDRSPHDRGPHIRIPTSKITDVYSEVRVLLG